LGWGDHTARFAAAKETQKRDEIKGVEEGSGLVRGKSDDSRGLGKGAIVEHCEGKEENANEVWEPQKERELKEEDRVPSYP